MLRLPANRVPGFANDIIDKAPEDSELHRMVASAPPYNSELASNEL